MTDRVNALFVVLDQDIRDERAEVVINAIRQIRGVIAITPNIVEPSDYIAQQRARMELVDKLWKVLEPT